METFPWVLVKRLLIYSHAYKSLNFECYLSYSCTNTYCMQKCKVLWLKLLLQRSLWQRNNHHKMISLPGSLQPNLQAFYLESSRTILQRKPLVYIAHLYRFCLEAAGWLLYFLNFALHENVAIDFKGGWYFLKFVGELRKTSFKTAVV